MSEECPMSVMVIDAAFATTSLDARFAHDFVHAEVVARCKRIGAIWIETGVVHAAEPASFHLVYADGLSELLLGTKEVQICCIFTALACNMLVLLTVTKFATATSLGDWPCINCSFRNAQSDWIHATC